MANLDGHKKIETNATLLLALSLLVVTVGGIVEIAPLFYLENTIEDVEGMRPYSPLELAGRNIYIREGCYVCHSQMIRPDAGRGGALRPLQPRGGASTTIRSSGAPSGRGPTSPASAAATRTSGMWTTCDRSAIGGAGIGDAGIVAYTFRPGSKAVADDMAKLPLREDDHNG
jgi:hypothetical protein